MRKLHPLCNITLSESLEAVATLASKHSLSNSAVEDILKLIKLHLPKTTQYPSAYYKYRKQLGNTKEFYELRFYCDSCKILLTENHSCPTCNSEYDKLSIRKDGNFFIEFNMERQLRCILDSQDVQRELTDFFHRALDPTICVGIQSGQSYLQSVKRSTDFSLSFNSDGVNIFNSSNRRSLYPILLLINELPYYLSKKYYLLGGLWYGEGKPNFDLFLQGIIEQMNALYTQGLTWKTMTGTEITSFFHFPICPVDCPIRCVLQGLKQFNGCFGCTWCDHPGKQVKKGAGSARVYVDPQATDSCVAGSNDDFRWMIFVWV